MNAEYMPMLILIGCGDTFDTVASALPRIFETADTWRIVPVASSDTAVAEINVLLEKLDPAVARLFIAIDQHWMNDVRLEAYAMARLRGFKCGTLAHSATISAPEARIGENCWIGAGAVIGVGVCIGNNTIISSCARLDAGAQIGPNVWIGPGAVVGRNTRIGAHCVIGADVIIRADLVLGRYCSIDLAGRYSESLQDGTFIDPLFPLPVKLVGKAGVRPVQGVRE